MVNKTLILGIQDLDSIPYGATLRVKQLANTIPNAVYLNVGDVQWNSRSTISKLFELIRFGRPWREPFAAYHYSNKKANELIRYLQQNQFKQIILSEIWMFHYLKTVRRYGKKAQIIFDLHNVESMLQEEIASSKGSWYEFWRSLLIRRMEKRIVESCHHVWVCSKNDADNLKSLYGSVSLNVVPNTFQVKEGQFIENLTSDKVIGYVGCFNYPPNMEAAMELVKDILPLMNNVKLVLVGKNPGSLKDFESENVRVTGEVVSISDELKGIALMVLPIRNGSGTRLKVLEAMAHGIPIVATGKAVEGLDLINRIHFMKAETVEEFVSTISFLLRHSDVRNILRWNARNLVLEKYSWRG